METRSMNWISVKDSLPKLERIGKSIIVIITFKGFITLACYIYDPDGYGCSSDISLA